MKKKILISIQPTHVQNILSGIKKYEYRKAVAKQEVSSLLIYETTPIMKVVAEVDVLDIVAASPADLWNQTKESSGISKKFFDEYFNGRDIAYAYKLGKVKVFKQPKKLSDYGVKYAPQSFLYVQ